MIELLSKTDAERLGVDPRDIQCISPYLNSAHILAPPRRWLEGVLREDCSWHFFRLRYKNLLRNRYQAEPERFIVDGWVDVENWGTALIAFSDGSRAVAWGADTLLGGMESRLDFQLSNARPRVCEAKSR